MAQIRLPKITIEYCTQCRWMLRAAYYAQELLSTFGTAIGEISLRPATGGVFVVSIEQLADSTTGPAHEATQRDTKVTLLWDRKVDQGFPETKQLKRRLRDIIEPGRDLGHVDRHDTRKDPNKAVEQSPESQSTAQAPETKIISAQSATAPTESKHQPIDDTCEDCSAVGEGQSRLT